VRAATAASRHQIGASTVWTILGVQVVLATGRSRANVLDVAAAVGLRTPAVSPLPPPSRPSVS
jgi:hydroxymethylpyrimidine pyrophosphatase-like HAD family hydrolase